jgi:hypothetical protein
MTESSKNRWFYKFTEQEEKDYRTNDGKHIKFIIRLNPDFPQSIEKYMKMFPHAKMNRRNNKGTDKENVEKYEWDLTPFDNLNYGDEYNFISFCIVRPGPHIEELIDTFKNNFNIYKKKNGKSYTIKIDHVQTIRGVWRDKEDLGREPKYPIAILSFNRYNVYGRTHILLTKLKIKHYLFVEPFELEQYANWYNPEYCWLIPYDKDLHLQNMGSTPARNFILNYFKHKEGGRVWMLDDNIKDYKRLYSGVKNNIESAEIFTSIEDYVDRYNNVGIASHNFQPYVNEGGNRTILIKNGKCYSSMLIPTNVPIRFEHKHQEDNFISIKYVCEGYTNLCFNHITYNKNTSGLDKGGNTKFIYKEDEDDIGRKERFDYSFAKAKELIEEGEIVLIDDKWVDDFVYHRPIGHEHYHVQFNYSILKNHDINDISKKRGYKKKKYVNNLIFVAEEEKVVEIEKTEKEKLLEKTKEELVEIILSLNSSVHGKNKNHDIL